MIRDLLLIGSFGLVGVCWYVLQEGKIRNVALLVSGAFAFFLLLSRNTPTFTRETDPNDVSPELTNQDISDILEESLDPSRSLSECLRYYKIHEHPTAHKLMTRVSDYRQIVIKIAKERGGTGTIWRDSDDDIRVRSCLCGDLTREEMIKGLGIQERDPDPPKVGAGMGLENAIRKLPIAEDGKPARRLLFDPIADKDFNILIAHRPEAKHDLLLARDRYIENVLRRLVGPLDGRGNPIVPLCIWKKRFDGKHYNDFEAIESRFMG